MATSPDKPNGPRGIWATYREDDGDCLPVTGQAHTQVYDVAIHSSEISALRDAVTSGRLVVFVPYGHAVAAAAANRGGQGTLPDKPPAKKSAKKTHAPREAEAENLPNDEPRGNE